ncbi:MAG TPA: HDOD domain-containing protein, partial [Polyangiaceae bacterium]
MTHNVAQLKTRKYSADLDRGLDPELLKRRMLELFRSPTYKPPLLPAVALELLELTRRPRTGAAEIVSLMGHDPVLAGQVLRLARSALYSGGQPLRSLDEAVTRLGLSRISDLLLQVSLEATVFRAAGFREVMNSLRRHCVFVAEASRIVEKHVMSCNPSAFLCGLLHDVGVAACILALGGPLKGLAPLGFDQAWPSVGEVHAECSELLAQIWGLPADVASV